MPRHVSLILISILLLLCLTDHPLSAKPLRQDSVAIEDSQQRTWKTADGKFRQEGTLVEVAGNNVRLLTPQGKRMTVPLAKLSKEDKKFVELEIARNATPFKEDEASPFEPDGEDMKTPAPSSENALKVSLRLAAARPIQLQSKDPIDLKAQRWKAPEVGKIAPIQVPCESIHWAANHCFSSADNKYVVVSFHDPFAKTETADHTGPDSSQFDQAFDSANAQMRKAMEDARKKHEQAFGQKKRSSNLPQSQKGSMYGENWVEVYEIPSGKLSGKYLLPPETEVSDYNPQSKQFLAVSGKFSHERTVQVFELKNNQLVLSKIGQSSMEQGSIQSARFLSDGKLAVCLNDKLVVLDGDKLEPAFSCTNTDLNWRLANDRKHAIIESQGRKFEVDLVAGKCTAAQGQKNSKGGMGVVSPDEKFTAECANRALTIRDQKGSIVDQFFVPVFWSDVELTWLDAQTLRAQSPGNHLHFIDLKNRASILEVMEMGDPTNQGRGWNVSKQPHGGGDWFFTISPVLASSEDSAGLPSLDECRSLLGGKPNQLLLLKKGDRISIKIDLKADSSITNEVKERVEKMLADRGVIIDDSADDELRLESSASEETIEYKRFGSSPWDSNAVEKVNVRRISSSMSLVRDEKTIWSVGSHTGSPGFILLLKEGETAQQAVDRQNIAPGEFWKNLKLPRNIAIHPNGHSWARYRKAPDGYHSMN